MIWNKDAVPIEAAQPSTEQELAALLHNACARGQTIRLYGDDSKRLAAGPVLPADMAVSTVGLNRILQHERNDLTISVQAGMRFSDLQTYLRRHNQMIALDPPFSADATVGGILAADSNGPLRKRFGTVRDQVIGLTLVTVDGRIVKAGGMVVKNVAGLDISKLMIGSFGTLAAIASVNLRVHPRPPATQTFLFSLGEVEAALVRRDEIMVSPLTPISIELLSPPAAARLGRRHFLLAVRAAGSPAVLARYARDLNADEVLLGDDEAAFWNLTSNYTSDFLARSPNGVVLRLGTPLTALAQLFRIGAGTYVSRAASGVTYAYCNSWETCQSVWTAACELGWSAAVAFAPHALRADKRLWRLPLSAEHSNGFAMMKKVKSMFDPGNLLNRSRLYGRL